MSISRDQQQLLELIHERRRSIEIYLSRVRPRSERLMMVTIVSSAIAAVLNAGPALGGAKFALSAAEALGLSGPAQVWQPLCLLAMIVSVVAVVSANLGKSKNSESRIVNAETSYAELEGLQALVEFHQVPLKEAVKMYQQCVARVPFVPDETPDRLMETPQDRPG